MAKRDYEISLIECSQSKVKDIYGYMSRPFGDPLFKVTRIEFENGKIVDVEGEHDMPYIINEDGVLNLPECEDDDE